MTTYTVKAQVREENLGPVPENSAIILREALITLVSPDDSPLDLTLTGTPDENGLFDSWNNPFSQASIIYPDVSPEAVTAFQINPVQLLGASSDDSLSDPLTAKVDASYINAIGDLVLAEFAFRVNDPSWNTDPIDPNDLSIFNGTLLEETTIGSTPSLNLTDAFIISEDDLITGTTAAEWLNAGAGNDSVNLGDGIDTYSFVDMNEGTTASLTEGVATIGALTKTLSDIENLTGSSFADFIEGDAGSNVLRGLGGTDWFIATAGSDQYDGGAASDTVSYVASSAGVTVDLDRAQIDANGQFVDTFVSIENVTGSSFADVIIGNASDNVLRGLGGNDVFYGTSGEDRYDGGAGLDIVSYANASEGVFAWLQEPPTNGTSIADGDTFDSIESLIGSAFDDVLRGTNVNGTQEWLYGEAGNDRLIGDAGIDYLTGGTGDDYLDGHTGWDYALIDGTLDEFSYVTNSNGKTILTHLDGGELGVDTLVNIQVMRFTDGDILLGAGF